MWLDKIFRGPDFWSLCFVASSKSRFQTMFNANPCFLMPQFMSYLPCTSRVKNQEALNWFMCWATTQWCKISFQDDPLLISIWTLITSKWRTQLKHIKKKNTFSPAYHSMWHVGPFKLYCGHVLFDSIFFPLTFSIACCFPAMCVDVCADLLFIQSDPATRGRMRVRGGDLCPLTVCVCMCVCVCLCAGNEIKIINNIFLTFSQPAALPCLHGSVQPERHGVWKRNSRGESRLLWVCGRQRGGKKREFMSVFVCIDDPAYTDSLCVHVCVQMPRHCCWWWECGAANPRGEQGTAEEMLGRSPLIRVTAVGGWCGEEIRNRIRKRASRV